MIQGGLIVRSKSPWCSPVKLVAKPDGAIRITIDYKKLNKVTIKDAYPLPNINTMLAKLKEAKVYSKFDLAYGYYQIPMDPESQKYTAFICEFGLYEYRVMPMGLSCSGASFQRTQDAILGDYIGTICYVYMDDILVFLRNLAEHEEHGTTKAVRISSKNKQM